MLTDESKRVTGQHAGDGAGTEGPRPEDFGLTAEEVERVEGRHDLICRRLVSVPLLVALAASTAGFLAVCDCNLLVALMLALGLVAFFVTLLGLVSTILIFAAYPIVAGWVSPSYRAVRRFRAAQEQHEALQRVRGGQGA